MRPVYASNTHLPELNAQTGAFVSHLCFGMPDQIERFCSMAVFHGEQLVAGTLYHNWHPESGVIELSSASTDRRWLTKPVVKAMFHMAFDLWLCACRSVMREWWRLRKGLGSKAC